MLVYTVSVLMHVCLPVAARMFILHTWHACILRSFVFTVIWNKMSVLSDGAPNECSFRGA